MQNIRNPTYNPTINNREYVAIVPLTVVDTAWTIFPIGTVDGEPNPINPNWVTIDNLLNRNQVTIQYGPYEWVIPAFTRKTMRLPVPTQTVIITKVLTDTFNVFFVENPSFTPDDQDFLAIQEAARGVSLYPWVIYNAVNSPQQLTDANSTVEFIGVGIDIVYTLLDIALSGVKNGWFQFVFNNGTRPVSITPFGGDTVNGIFNNAKPFILYPGESGTLQSDGTQWFIFRFGRRLPSVTETAFSVTMLPSHLGARVLFSNVLGQQFALMPVTTLKNGDRCTVKNGGSGVVAVAPDGAETINGLFTAGSPLNLYPGDEIDLLVGASGTWEADGGITFESPDIAIAVGGTGTIAHGMKKQPFIVEAWVRCVTASLNYAVGDEFLLGNTQSVSSDAGANHVFRADATNLRYTLTNRTVFRLSDANTGADTNITLANFVIFLRASVTL